MTNFINNTEHSAVRYRFYNNFIQSIESPSVRGKIQSHIADWSVDNSILDSIIELLEEEQFISAKRMSEVLEVPKSTLLLKLHNELGLVKVNLRWVPHLLTEENKQQRVDLSFKNS